MPSRITAINGEPIEAGWITPTPWQGEFLHPVGEVGEHHTWLLKHYNMTAKEEKKQKIDLYVVAFSHGYVRFRINIDGSLDLEGKKERIKKTFKHWERFIKGDVYLSFSERYGEMYVATDREELKRILGLQLNESVYLGRDGEYGGWITADKKVHPVDSYSHYEWVANRYGIDRPTSYDTAFEDGAVRYILARNGLELNGYMDAIKTLFNIWWPTAMRKNSVLIDHEPSQAEWWANEGEPPHDLYQMPEHKQDLLNKWRPEHPTRAMVKKMGIGESILNELHEYLGLEEEYGGWITSDKKVHIVEPQGHENWVKNNYDSDYYETAFDDGAVRYQINYKLNELNLQGYTKDLQKLFFVWWPSAVASDTVYLALEDGSSNSFLMPDQKEELRTIFKKPKSKNQEPVMAPQGGKWWHENPGVKVESVQLNELREYLGLEEEYGGWITADKEVHTVGEEGHEQWIVDNFFDGNWEKFYNLDDEYSPAWKIGAIRYILERTSQNTKMLSIQGHTKDIKNLFRIWYPTALNSVLIYIDEPDENPSSNFKMPDDKEKLKRKYGPRPRIREDGFGKRKDRSLGASYTVSIYKHQVNNIDEGKWNEQVRKVKDVNSGMSRQGALVLQRKIIDELESRNSHNDNGWVDYFTRIQEDDINETEGGTVGFMFRGGYQAGMRTTAKNTKKRTKWSPLGNRKVNEKYNTNSTWLKVGKNIVEVILNKVTRRVKRGKKITEEEIATYKIFVDGVDVGYIDNIDKLFLVKDDKTWDRYDNLEEAISKVMGDSYYDGTGSTEFVEFNPDPYSLSV